MSSNLNKFHKMKNSFCYSVKRYTQFTQGNLSFCDFKEEEKSRNQTKNFVSFSSSKFKNIKGNIMNSAPEKAYQIGQGPMGAGVVAQLSSVHPLKSSEENYEQNVFQRDMQMLRKFEGLHAPLKLAMERHAFKTVGRLACLPSSNAHLDVLSGRDEMIDFTDFLGGAEYSEKLTNPHAVVAKSLNIL